MSSFNHVRYSLEGNQLCFTTKHSINVRRSASVMMASRRPSHAAIVAGNYLYVDGGEVTMWNGEGNGLQATNPQSRGGLLTQADNYTYSIDLSSSWTNSSLTLTQIAKSAPVLNTGALWLDASGDIFYAYDGSISGAPPTWYNNEVPTNSVWQFSPSGDSGLWSLAPVAPSSNFSVRSRVSQAAYAYGNGLGFALGGIENAATELYTDINDVLDWSLVPGKPGIHTRCSDRKRNPSTPSI